MLFSKIKEIIEKKYTEQLKSIRTISFDSANKEVLCDSDFKCWDFDGIIKSYSAEKGTDRVSTPDLLYFESDHLVFVEFKNGKFDSTSRKNTRLKIIEGPFIGLKELLELNDVSTGINELNNLSKSYIVVYNPEKHQRSRSENPAKYFHEPMKRLTERRSILERYENVFVDKVHMLSPDNFLRFFVEKWKSENE